MSKEMFDQIIEKARKVSMEKINPGAADADSNRSFPWESVRALGDAGLNRLGVTENNGGAGLGRTYFTSVVKEISKCCASTALVYVSNSIALKAMELGANEELKNKWLTKMMDGSTLGVFAVHEPVCGSNAGAIATKAVKDGDFYILNGTKFFITSAGEADVYFVLVRTDPEKGPQGMSILLVEKDTPGFTFGKPEEKLGLKSTSSREIYFNDCKVPVKNLIGNEGEGIPVMGKTLVGWGFHGAAAISVGIAKAATDLAIKHAKERTIGGQPIAVHQAVQSMIADMALKTEAMDALLDRYAEAADAAPDKAAFNSFKSKLFASETAIEVTNLAMQIMGGHGYCKDYVVERLLRDARGLTLHFKTSEWLRQDIAKALTGI